MKNIQKYIPYELISYLFFGVLATLVYIIVRTILFFISKQATVSAILANTITILFAFWTNDRFVFKQEKKGWEKRLVSFFVARLLTLIIDLLLAFLFVQHFPNIIGQFVNHNMTIVNLIESIISQIVIIVLNYIISKLFIFKSKSY